MRDLHTLRGLVPANTNEVVFDNDLRNVGWVIKEFYFWADGMDTNPYVWGKLWIGNDTNGATNASDIQDNRCIGWAWSAGNTGEAQMVTIVDPQHIVTGQLRVINGGGSESAYLIVLERKSLTTDQEIMALIKERSQDDI